MATIAGFVGVLLVLRPDVAGTNQYGLLAVGAMVMVATREVVTRGLAREIPSLIVTLCSTLTVAIVGGVFSMFQEKWVTMGLYEVGILNLSSVFLFGAYFLSVVALRHGEVSLVGPFRYAVILWSLLVGFLIWGDIPDFVALSGMALIAAAGLLVVRSEFRQRRQG
jgi:drug/metabolite transporter (DMT)-like permease